MASQERTTQTFNTIYGFNITITEGVEIPGNLDSERPEATCSDPVQVNIPPKVCKHFQALTGGGNVCGAAEEHLKHPLTYSGGRVRPRCMVG